MPWSRVSTPDPPPQGTAQPAAPAQRQQQHRTAQQIITCQQHSALHCIPNPTVCVIEHATEPPPGSTMFYIHVTALPTSSTAVTVTDTWFRGNLNTPLGASMIPWGTTLHWQHKRFKAVQLVTSPPCGQTACQFGALADLTGNQPSCCQSLLPAWLLLHHHHRYQQEQQCLHPCQG